MIKRIADLKKMLNHRSETIFGAAMVMSSLTLIGSLLGILRNALLAGRFGASGNLDIYYSSFRLPDLIYNIFVVGAISAAFIPVFSDYWAKEKEKAWQFVNVILMGLGLFIGFFALIIGIFASPILSLILRGFDPTKLEMAVILTRIMMIQPVFLGISSVLSGILKKFNLFFSSALAPLMYNLGIIVGILILVPLFGLKGISLGVVLGAVLHLLIQIPALIGTGFKLKLNFSYFKELKEGLNKITVIMATRSLGIVVYQFFLLGITGIATMLKEGSLAILNFANDIQNLPQIVFALAFAEAAFPRLAEFEAEQKREDYLKVFISTLSQIIFFLIPFAVWFIVFREPIVRFLLGYGKFDWQATIKTMEVLAILSAGMVFQGINAYLLRVFFSKKDALRPFLASLTAYSLGFLLCYYGGLNFGLSGLAGAIACTYLLYFLILFVFLRHYIPFSFFKEFFHSFARIIFISFVSGITGYLTFSFLEGLLPTEKVFYLLVNTGIAFVFSLVVFVALSYQLKIKELNELIEFIKRKIYVRKR